MPEKKKFYYYTRWCDYGDATLDPGFYHSTWETEATFKEFLSGILPTKEVLIKCFNTIHEMNDFAVTVGLPKFPVK